MCQVLPGGGREPGLQEQLGGRGAGSHLGAGGVCLTLDSSRGPTCLVRIEASKRRQSWETSVSSGKARRHSSAATTSVKGFPPNTITHSSTPRLHTCMERSITFLVRPLVEPSGTSCQPKPLERCTSHYHSRSCNDGSLSHSMSVSSHLVSCPSSLTAEPKSRIVTVRRSSLEYAGDELGDVGDD